MGRRLRRTIDLAAFLKPSGCDPRGGWGFSWIIQGNEKAPPSAGSFCRAPYLRAASPTTLSLHLLPHNGFAGTSTGVPAFFGQPRLLMPLVSWLSGDAARAPLKDRMRIRSAGDRARFQTPPDSSRRKLPEIKDLLSIWPHDETVPHPLCPTHMRHKVGRRSLVPAAVQLPFKRRFWISGIWARRQGRDINQPMMSVAFRPTYVVSIPCIPPPAGMLKPAALGQ
jgi:hypothetical protein